MRRWWWLYGLFITLLIIVSIELYLFFNLKNRESENSNSIDNKFFLGEQTYSRGYGSYSDDETNFRAIVKLNDVYMLDNRILADIQWSEGDSNKQTVEIGNFDELNFTYLVKQASRELFPESSQMEYIRVESKNLVTELKPYLDQDVIVSFYTATPKVSDELSEEIKDYLKNIDPYIECNKNFSIMFSGDSSEKGCRPFSHQIYVVQD